MFCFMKRYILPGLFVIGFILIPLMCFPQSASLVSNEVVRAIRQGNSGEMAKHFSTNVDLKLPGSEGTFSRSQAEVILKNFFSRNSPQFFSENHRGASRDGSEYVIGTYVTRNGRAYRVYFYVKKVSDSFFLHQVQFEMQ